MNKCIARMLGVLVVLTGGCAVGPDYHRPTTSLPAVYRGGEATTAATLDLTQPDFAQARWWTIFADPVLQSLIHESLQNNYDLRIAANRVIQEIGRAHV